MSPAAWVAFVAAGAIGAPLHYLIDGAVQDRTEGVFPWGTFVGLAMTLCARRRQNGHLYPVEVRGPTTPKARDARQLGRFRDDVARRKFLTA